MRGLLDWGYNMLMSIFSGKRMRELRKSRVLTQKQVAEALNLTQAQVSRYENDVDEPGHGIGRDIAAFFNVAVAYLYGETNEKEQYYAKPDGALPIFENVCAGDGVPAFGTPIGYMSAPPGKRGKMWIRVRGESMAPAIVDGDYVLVDDEGNIEHGDKIVAFVDGEAVVKFYQKTDDGFILTSANPSFPVFKPNGLQFSIIGKVTGTFHPE